VNKKQLNMSDIVKTEVDLKLILSSVRALWGQITPSLRSVSIELRDKTIVWQCLFDTNATEDDFELVSDAAAEVIADFNEYGLEEIIEYVAFPTKLSNLKNLVYFRYEHNYYKE
jgi:hypothetical protein